MKLSNPKIYFSSSKGALPTETQLVYNFLKNCSNIIIKEYKGGTFNPSSVDECSALIIVPPTNNKSSIGKIYVGRGQYDMAKRAIQYMQEVFIYHENQFVRVKNIINVKVDDNWQNNYGILNTAYAYDSAIGLFNSNALELTEKFMQYKKSLLSSAPSSAPSQDTSNTPDEDLLLAASLVYPQVLKK